MCRNDQIAHVPLASALAGRKEEVGSNLARFRVRYQLAKGPISLVQRCIKYLENSFENGLLEGQPQHRSRPGVALFLPCAYHSFHQLAQFLCDILSLATAPFLRGSLHVQNVKPASHNNREDKDRKERQYVWRVCSEQKRASDPADTKHEQQRARQFHEVLQEI